jgi:competence protein ComEA
VVVHVVGAVARPGIVTLPGGSRVSGAVERAGGARDDADLARLNLARVLVDGERLYVPKVGETDIPAALDGSSSSVGGGGGGAGSDGAGGGAGSAVDAAVDLNTADQTLLETLPGIGPSLAGRILAWRDEHGRFAAVEDLLDVSGIGDVRFAELRDRVRV